ncbi:MAG TPA: PP2C family serine/threonine-protein phosphatase [Candidatus Limnocylindrales bacterium]|nr:PP2C family serine/threonine-protein phosphatase [Candidatus Limnocylindrales bacterium]
MDDDRGVASHRAARLERGPGCGGATDIGPVRERNEDAFWISEDASALIVADGLGGLPAGDIASTLAVAAASQFLASTAADPPVANTPESIEAGLRRTAHEAAAEAQQVLIEASERYPQLRGMATTLVIVLIDGLRATVLQIGDSRAALWRLGRMVQETIDQNFAGDMVREGVLTADEARRHPSRNLVREVVGLPGGYQAECHTWSLEPGDVVLAFTDGVSETVPAAEISRILGESSDAATAAVEMVRTAAALGGSDNATAIVRYVT